jgi:hypothetical protein
MSVVLLNAAGTPEPSPEIQRRLRGVDPHLHLRFVQAGGSHWAICWTWRDSDPRRERIQQRDLDPDKAYDIIGYLPMTCPADEAPAYLERSLRTFPKDEIQRVADDIYRYNQSAPVNAALEEAMAEVLDRADPTGLVKRPRGRPRKAS